MSKVRLLSGHTELTCALRHPSDQVRDLMLVKHDSSVKLVTPFLPSPLCASVLFNGQNRSMYSTNGPWFNVDGSNSAYVFILNHMETIMYLLVAAQLGRISGNP